MVGGGVFLGDYFETPEEATLRQSPEVVPVTDPLQREVLERTLRFRAATAPAERSAPRFAAATAGRIVTDVFAVAGQEIRSGEVLLEVEGRPVIVLTGSFPGWRDLTWPMPAGRDISQLQSALAELDLYQDEVDGKYEASTLRAVFALYDSIGYDPPSRSDVIHGEFVFVPSGLRIVERVGVEVGDTFDAEAITLASAAQRLEAELSADQRQLTKPGLILRATGLPGEPWSSVIERVAEVEAPEDAAGPTTAIYTTDPIPSSLLGHPAWEIVVEATDGPVLSASPAAVHLNPDRDPYVVVLEGSEEVITPVRVGVVTNSRAEVTSVVEGALQPGDALVLNPDR